MENDAARRQLRRLLKLANNRDRSDSFMSCFSEAEQQGFVVYYSVGAFLVRAGNLLGDPGCIENEGIVGSVVSRGTDDKGVCVCTKLRT